LEDRFSHLVPGDKFKQQSGFCKRKNKGRTTKGQTRVGEDMYVRTYVVQLELDKKEETGVGFRSVCEYYSSSWTEQQKSFVDREGLTPGEKST
jgi:hypothetical protein